MIKSRTNFGMALCATMLTMTLAASAVPLGPGIIVEKKQMPATATEDSPKIDSADTAKTAEAIKAVGEKGRLSAESLKTALTAEKHEDSAPTNEYAGDAPGVELPNVKEVRELQESKKCKDVTCKKFEVKLHQRTYTVSTYAGLGNNMQSLGNNNSYYGVMPNQSSSSSSKTPTMGIQVSMEDKSCTKEVDVAFSVNEAIDTYIGALIDPTPGTNHTYDSLTPAQEAMLILYNSMMDLAKGGTCN